MKSSYNIGKIQGIDINIHITWLLVFALLAWSLATDFFPAKYKFIPAMNWVLGLSAAILLFASVLLHELSHSIVSQKNHMKVESITLFFFGGVSNIGSDTPNAKTEFWMAIAGPLTSIAIGVVSFIIFRFTTGYVKAIFDYLYTVNLILAAFNMIPGYPLDGGRVLRSALWTYYKDIKKATRIASTAGQIFGYMMVVFGFLNMLSGGFGLWYVFLGAFLVFLAKAGYEQLAIRTELSKLRLRAFLSEARTVSPTMSIEDFLDWCEKNNISYGVARQKGNFYVIDISEIARIPKQAWHAAKIGNLMKKVSAIDIEDEPSEVFNRMRIENVRIIPVLKSGKLVGVIVEDTFINKLKVMSLKNG